MSDLLKFYDLFIKQGYEGVHKVQDEHTLHLCENSHLISSDALTFVASICPPRCSWFVASYDTIYICVYDD